jgi:nucleotide-binding universal stress UspA family protein
VEIKNLLFATDFSEGSSLALPYAVDLAKRYRAKLFLVHVVYDLTKTAGWYVPNTSVDEIYRDIEKSARAELERFSKEETTGVAEIEYAVLKGTPYEEITKFVAENKIDLIVLGTHGRKGIDRVLFGSTAEQIVRNAPCPVLSVRFPKSQDE